MRAKTDAYAHNLYYQESDFEVVRRVGEIAQRRGVPNAQVALAWVLQKPGITAPIVGATKTEQLKDLIAAVDIKLAPEEVAALEKPYTPHKILGHAQPSPKSMVRS